MALMSSSLTWHFHVKQYTKLHWNFTPSGFPWLLKQLASLQVAPSLLACPSFHLDSNPKYGHVFCFLCKGFSWPLTAPWSQSLESLPSLPQCPKDLPALSELANPFCFHVCSHSSCDTSVPCPSLRALLGCSVVTSSAYALPCHEIP